MAQKSVLFATNGYSMVYISRKMPSWYKCVKIGSMFMLLHNTVEPPFKVSSGPVGLNI